MCPPGERRTLPTLSGAPSAKFRERHIGGDAAANQIPALMAGEFSFFRWTLGLEGFTPRTDAAPN